MPNTLITPTIIARTMLDVLNSSITVADLVHRDFDADFAGQAGDTINVRRPASFTAVNFESTGTVAPQDITEVSVPVTIGETPDVSFALTARELSLKITSLEDQLLIPAAQAIAAYLDAMVITKLETATATLGTVATMPAPSILTTARKTLSDAKVDTSRRFGIVNTAVAANWLALDEFKNVACAGTTDALREASLGRRYGFDLYESNRSVATRNVFAHRNAVCLAVRTPAAPLGVAPDQYAVRSNGSIGLRVVWSYNSSTKKDQCSVDLFAGATVLNQSMMVQVRN